MSELMQSEGKELISVLTNAARQAIAALFKRHSESFYYCSLITNGEGNCPVVSAWSVEALEVASRREKDVNRAKIELKWSYADSPYYAFGEEHFETVKKIFEERRELLKQNCEAEFAIRISAMEQAMSTLDQERMFGCGESRSKIVVNAEVMPPDYGNTIRGIKLNPPAAIEEWLVEAAEEA